jgi:hypothetical protein
MTAVRESSSQKRVKNGVDLVGREFLERKGKGVAEDGGNKCLDVVGMSELSRINAWPWQTWPLEARAPHRLRLPVIQFIDMGIHIELFWGNQRLDAQI